MKPVLMRRVEMEEIRNGLNWLDVNLPADAYMYGHTGMHEDVVEILRAAGKRVFRSYSQLYVHHSALSWEGSYQKLLYEIADEGDYWLRDREGRQLYYAAYEEARIFDWSKVSEDHLNMLVDFVLTTSRSPSGQEIRLDNVFPTLEEWMFWNPRTLGQVDWSSNDWSNSLLYLIEKILEAGVVPLINGKNSWSHGGGHEWEGADTGRQGYEFWDAYGYWMVDRGNSAIEIVSKVDRPHVIPAILTWKEAGGILECREKEVADLAWRLKGN